MSTSTDDTPSTATIGQTPGSGTPASGPAAAAAALCNVIAERRSSV